MNYDMKTTADRMNVRNSIEHAFRIATVSCYILMGAFTLLAVDLLIRVVW